MLSPLPHCAHCGWFAVVEGLRFDCRCVRRVLRHWYFNCVPRFCTTNAKLIRHETARVCGSVNKGVVTWYVGDMNVCHKTCRLAWHTLLFCMLAVIPLLWCSGQVGISCACYSLCSCTFYIFVDVTDANNEHLSTTGGGGNGPSSVGLSIMLLIHDLYGKQRRGVRLRLSIASGERLRPIDWSWANSRDSVTSVSLCSTGHITHPAMAYSSTQFTDE